MAFKRMKGVVGLVYVPDEDGGEKKHPCADCYSCQWCSDERCRLCLRGKARRSCGGCRGKKRPARSR
ncbi:MAG: hypothetical protein QM765_50760 [Myxococcales bacterium]